MRSRGASISLTVATPSWRAPRPPTPRRATFPLCRFLTSSVTNTIRTPPVPALSYWLPDTPSPFSPKMPMSPVSPFLVPPPPQQPLFRIVSPLIPASPLSMFDMAVSPGYAVSPMGSTFGVGISPLSPTFFFSRTPTPTRVTFASPAQQTFLLPISPLSPRFMYPRTPPYPRQPDSKSYQQLTEGVVVESAAQKRSVQHALNDFMGRKASIASVLSVEQERMHMKINFYQWLAVRRWESMEGRKESKWHGLRAKKLRSLWSKMIGKEENAEKRRMSKQSRFKLLKEAVVCI
jgi:hypothetical protein